MALKKCGECSTLISTKAESCPTCGEKTKKKHGIFTWIFLALFFSIVYTSCRNIGGSGAGTQGVSSSPVNQPATIEAPVSEKAKWSVSSSTDKMTDEKVTAYSVRSINSVVFDFPYKVAGGSYLKLVIRKGSKSFDAYLIVDKGQVMCSYSDCWIYVRVDGGKPQRWTGLTSSTNNHDLIFVKDAKALEALAKKGASIRIGIDFYQAGQQTFDFDLGGYPGN